MRILWVCGTPAGALAERRGLKMSSGQWINAEIANEKVLSENELFFCTSDDFEDRFSDGNITYIVLAHGKVSRYVVNEQSIASWSKLFDEISPDVILVWGTEYEISRCAMLANGGKRPAVLYIQGVMRSVADNYRGGLTDREINKMTTLVERLRKNSVYHLEARQVLAAKREKETVGLAGRIIVENDWAAEQYKGYCHNLRVYHNRLPMKKEFTEFNWKDSCDHSILTTAAAYPLKGLHVTLRALTTVLEQFPDTKLYVPGNNPFIAKGLKAKLKQSGYAKMIVKYIKKNHLADKVIFTGPLSSEQYAEKMSRCNVFVSSSATENHGSAIREAMCVGIPCVSSNVGGLSSYAKDGLNCKLFDFPDSRQLADEICELFDDAELRRRLSQAGKDTVNKLYIDEPLDTMTEIYKKILEE